MRNIKDLKEDILSGNYKNFYIFFGNDFGLRRHYIHKIAERYNQIKVIDSAFDIAESKTGSGLFKTSYLYVIYNDIDFAKSKSSFISQFVSNITDDCVIMVYENEYPNTTLFKEYQDNITQFPRVKDNIALEFVDSELKLSLTNKEAMIFNCENDYSKICIEADKIRNYAKSKNISQEVAYQELDMAGELEFRYPAYIPDDMMDDIFQGNFKNLAYWSKLLNEVYPEQFWITLTSIFYNYLIAYFISKYGKWDGGKVAYELGLPWGRIKRVRNFNLLGNPEYFLDTAFEITNLDQEIKAGKLKPTDLFDRFLTVIL